MICLRVGIDDSQVLQKELGQFTAEDLLNLNVGKAIVRMGTAKDSFNLQIPLVQVPVNDNKQEILNLAKQRKAAFSSSLPTSQTVASATVPPSSPSTLSSSLPTTPPLNTSPVSGNSTNPQANQTKNNLLPDEKIILEFLYQATEILPVSDLIQRIGFGSKKLYRLLNNLLQKGFIEEAQLSLSSTGRKSRIVVINQYGITALGYPTSQGKGGALHQYFQRVIKSYAEKQGYLVILEKPLDQQKSVDLSLEKDGQKTAVEISITTDSTKELSNIQKDLAAGYDRVIILHVNKNSWDALKKRVIHSFSPREQVRIFIPPLSGLFPLI